MSLQHNRVQRKGWRKARGWVTQPVASPPPTAHSLHHLTCSSGYLSVPLMLHSSSPANDKNQSWSVRAQCLQQEVAVLHSPAHTAHQRPAGEGLWEYLHNGLPSQWGKSENFAFNDISMQMAHISAFQQCSSPITFIVRATKYCDCKFVYIKDYVNRSTVSVAQKKNPKPALHSLFCCLLN